MDLDLTRPSASSFGGRDQGVGLIAVQADVAAGGISV